jgi:hypothetical protein
VPRTLGVSLAEFGATDDGTFGASTADFGAAPQAFVGSTEVAVVPTAFHKYVWRNPWNTTAYSSQVGQ